MIQWLINRSNATFWRFIATLAVVILGLLAWYGLHRDIVASENPCFADAHSRACESYVCHVGDTLGLHPSPECRSVLGLPPRKR